MNDVDPAAPNSGPPDFVDVYRFDDGWRWARLASQRAYDVMVEHLTKAPGSAPPDWRDHSWFMLFDDVGWVIIVLVYPPGGHAGQAVLKYTIFLGEDLAARTLPLAIELDPERTDMLQGFMANARIKLPQFIPDLAWERMNEREAQIVTREDALEALEYAFDSSGVASIYIVRRSNPGDPSVQVEVSVDPSIALLIEFIPRGKNADRNWVIYDWATNQQLGYGPTFEAATVKLEPPLHGRILRKSAYDAWWDEKVVPGQPTFDTEIFDLLDAKHPALMPVDFFLAVAREQGLL